MEAAAAPERSSTRELPGYKERLLVEVVRGECEVRGELLDEAVLGQPVPTT
jgi:hypothetical protein